VSLFKPIRVKVKLSSYLIKHHQMRTFVGVQLPNLGTGWEWSASYFPDRVLPVPNGGPQSPSGLRRVKKIPCPEGNRTPAVQPVSIQPEISRLHCYQVQVYTEQFILAFPYSRKREQLVVPLTQNNKHVKQSIQYGQLNTIAYTGCFKKSFTMVFQMLLCGESYLKAYKLSIVQPNKRNTRPLHTNLLPRLLRLVSID
jgi:hypothetical protein